MGDRDPPTGRLVLLLRHGESDHNAAGLMQGASDRPHLTPVGAAQAAAAVHLLPPRVDAMLVSPLTRAAQTAAILRAARPDLPAPQVLADLREIDLPEWEGHRFADLDRHDATRRGLWRHDPERLTMRGHDGRTLQPCGDAFARAAAVLARLRAEPEGATILVVAHGGIIRAIMALAFGLPRARLHVFGQDNATAHRLCLDAGGRARLLGFGEGAETAEARICRALAARGPLVALAPVAHACALARLGGLRLACSDAAAHPDGRILIPGDAQPRRAALARLAALPVAAAAALTPTCDGLHVVVPAGPNGPATITLLDAPAAVAAGLAKEI